MLEVTLLWREVVSEVAAITPTSNCRHMYVDNAAMQLVRAPKQFDVIVTGNLFGDILSDVAAMLTGSLGMLPSASLERTDGHLRTGAWIGAGHRGAGHGQSVGDHSVGRNDVAVLVRAVRGRGCDRGGRRPGAGTGVSDRRYPDARRHGPRYRSDGRCGLRGCTATAPESGAVGCNQFTPERITMSRTWDVAVVGATGAVGECMLEILAERGFPVGKVHALASERSDGKAVAFGRRALDVGNLADIRFLAGADRAVLARRQRLGDLRPDRGDAGCIVIDNTSQFRYDDDIPLIVPEVNAAALADYRNRNIIANPNCSTIQMVVALKPIYDAVGIERINVATYQAVSGTGKEAIESWRPRPRPAERAPLEPGSTRARSPSTCCRTSTLSRTTATRKKK